MDIQARVNPSTNAIVGAGGSVSYELWDPTQNTAGTDVSGEREKGREEAEGLHRWLGEAEVSAGRGKLPGCAKPGWEV